VASITSETEVSSHSVLGVKTFRIFQEDPPTALDGTAAADLAFSVTPSQ
jgi:hypothetical protein